MPHLIRITGLKRTCNRKWISLGLSVDTALINLWFQSWWVLSVYNTSRKSWERLSLHKVKNKRCIICEKRKAYLQTLNTNNCFNTNCVATGGTESRRYGDRECHEWRQKMPLYRLGFQLDHSVIDVLWNPGGVIVDWVYDYLVYQTIYNTGCGEVSSLCGQMTVNLCVVTVWCMIRCYDWYDKYLQLEVWCR